MSRVEAPHIYAGTIKPARSSRKLLKADGVTRDIIQAVNEVESTDRDDTQVFAGNFAPNLKGLQKLYWWVKMNIQYKEDPNGQQWVQTPSYLNQSRVGDCKSFTVFICSVLWNIGLDYIIRYVSDNPYSRYVTHVYPVAILPNGKKVPIDCVIGERERAATGKIKNHFNQEVKHYIKNDFFIKNKNEMAAIYKLGNVEAQNIKTMLQTDLFPDIPDSIIHQGPGDVTNMTSGQVDRIIMAERYDLKAKHSGSGKAAQYSEVSRAIKQGSIAGIGSISGTTKGKLHNFLMVTAADKAPAFQMPNLALPVDPALRGIGDWFKKQWKKLMNWLFKGPAKKMGPYFTFMWLKKRTPAIDRRRNIQYGYYSWIKKVGKFDDRKLKGLVFNGCLETTGLTPPQMLRKAAKGEDVAIGAIGLGAIIAAAFKAIALVVEVIQKIAKLFKKNKPNEPEPSKSNTSDLNMVEQMVEKENPSGQTPGSSGGGGYQGNPNSGDSSGAGAGMAAAAALFAAFAFT